MSGSGIGSVFLGDRMHHMSILHPGLHSPRSASPPTSPPPRPTVIDPILSLQLRIRWLEALVAGMKATKEPSDQKAKDLPPTGNLMRRAEDIHTKLHEALEENEACKKFLRNYDQYAPLLSPAAALSPGGSSAPPTYETLSQPEFETLVAELEPDIRAADRDLREIEELNGRGVSAAGKLPEHEVLKGRLQTLTDAQLQDLALFESLEARISNILHSYSAHVTSLSEVFVSWNDLLIEAEDRVDQLEKAKREESLVEFSS